MARKKDNRKRDQITFRLEEATFDISAKGAEDEDLKVADFARKLHRSALLLYQHFGSLVALKRHAERVSGKKMK